ncbi:FAD-dependent monooxygenase [Octadecabacter ascidiaceicola]|uniref:3-hydroxybenzoate 6-hydroxylase n=1 Tax=Octadecabacter ascidiaceicola TaxID=1655543 RepID=A0A238JMT5_9RHOB|nr:FAD-dependent monooxygenase [Octadecabacter ascidiaceicola]SMX31988.1 3-hydroxybenzoate 6-hydroxylase [Octadecabacter ascidiaceicola]
MRKFTGTTDWGNSLLNSDEIFSGGSNRGRRICVVGGGIGGLTAALAFAKSGAKVELHEQAPKLTEVGAGLQITPNGARALEALGLGDALDAVGVTAMAVEPMDAVRGQAVTRFDLTGMARPPYRFFHRADLIEVLAEGCRQSGVDIRLGSKVNAADMDADLVVGAEGIHSQTRVALNGVQEPFFTGQVAWRALIDAPDADPVARIWMAPGRHVVTYPVSGGRLNVVAVQERQQWAAEGWAHRDEAGNMRQAFRNTSGRLKGILGQVDEVHLWGLFRHPVAETWGRDGVCILGDAAHPTLPFLAQGANLAIEDAFVLARCCSEAPDVAAALGSYESLRIPRVTRAINAANANARNYHLSGVARTVAHTGLKVMGKVAPSAFMGRMDWLYGHDVTK